MSLIAANIITDDFKEIDASNCAIRVAQSDLFDFEVLTDAKPSMEDELVAA